MRVQISFIAQYPKTMLPFNYSHAISALIYKIIGTSCQDFASRLHEQGFSTEGRSFKLFTFSRLYLRSSRVIGKNLELQDPNAKLYVTSPVKEFIEHFVNGLFQQEVFEIAGARFVLQKAEIVAAPTFKPSMKFRAMSAITESVRDDFGQVKFLSTDEDWSEIIQRNLLRKYQALYGNLPKETKLKWTWDNDYIDLQNSKGHRSSALIDIHGIKVRGWLAPFKVEGSTELIKLGYETGFGARNSMGFGMVEHCI